MSHDHPNPPSPPRPPAGPPHVSADGDSVVNPDDQLLIAYLDGELDDPAAAELETRLADESGLRKRLHEFQKTWDMLDEVNCSTADNRFVKSTIEMVVTSATGKRTRWHRWPIRIGVGLVALALPAMLAFQTVRYFQNQPYRHFVANLQFWENVDMYDKIDSIEFVEQMRATGPGLAEFPRTGASGADDPSQSSTLPAASNEHKVARMNGTELKRIRNRQQRIEQLPAAAQDRLWDIHQQWQAHPQRDELLVTLQSYYEWWKTLSSEERARVKSASGPKCLQVVNDILRERAESVFGIDGETQLPPDDVTRLFEWTREFLEQKSNQIVRLYRSRPGRNNSRRGDRRLQGQVGLMFIFPRIPAEQAVPLFETQDIEMLRSQLSPQAVAIIDAQTKLSDRQKLVYRWAVSAVNAQWSQPVPERELVEFYELEMTPKQREMADAMSPERRRALITTLYRARRRQQSLPGVSPGRPWQSSQPESSIEKPDQKQLQDLD